MENLNIDQYINKVDGMALPAGDWNGISEALRDKINELVSYANDLQRIVAALRAELDTMHGTNATIVVDDQQYVFTDGILTDVASADSVIIR